MSALTVATMAAVADSERDILLRLDERVARLDRRIADGADHLTEIRTEVELTRISYEHQLSLTRRALERFLTAADRLDVAIDENIKALRSLRDQLTSGGNGPAAG